MMANRLRITGLILVASAFLSACATPPEELPQATTTETEAVAVAKVDESSMLQLLGYYQRLQRMPSPELRRERRLLATIPQTPATHVRMAMILGHPRTSTDLPRAISLLDGVLKSAHPLATSLHPLAQTLNSQYQERLKLETQNGKLLQNLRETQRLNDELKEKLNAMTTIEQSIPARPTGVPR